MLIVANNCNSNFEFNKILFFFQTILNFGKKFEGNLIISCIMEILPFTKKPEKIVGSEIVIDLS